MSITTLSSDCQDLLRHLAAPRGNMDWAVHMSNFYDDREWTLEHTESVAEHLVRLGLARRFGPTMMGGPNVEITEKGRQWVLEQPPLGR